MVQAPVIVCVDDDPLVLAALRRALRHEPWEVLTTSRAYEALGWVDRLDVSLVIADQRMPEMAGTELLEEVWRRRPWAVRAILTADPNSLRDTHGMTREAEHTILKPWKDEDLRTAVRRMVQERAANGGVVHN